MVAPELRTHATTGAPRPLLVWRFPTPRRVLSSAPVGGGLGERSWILNAQVPLAYDRLDLDAHVTELAAELGCAGVGAGMLTAAAIDHQRVAEHEGVTGTATVGVSKPTWAADVDGAISAWQPGTINVVVQVPIRLTDAALVNAVITATEAKTQALLERGIPGTGTASDAICVVCPNDGPAEAFAGPRSVWGARLARVTHAAVLDGLP